ERSAARDRLPARDRTLPADGPVLAAQRPAHVRPDLSPLVHSAARAVAPHRGHRGPPEPPAHAERPVRCELAVARPVPARPAGCWNGLPGQAALAGHGRRGLRALVGVREPGRGHPALGRPQGLQSLRAHPESAAAAGTLLSRCARAALGGRVLGPAAGPPPRVATPPPPPPPPP